MANKLLVECVAETLKQSQSTLDFDLSFLQNGGNSLLAYQLRQACLEHGMCVKIADILQCESITQLIGKAVVDVQAKPAMPSSPLPSLKRKRDSFTGQIFSRLRFNQSWHDTSLEPPLKVTTSSSLTELQRLLVLESLANPSANIIRFRETYQAAHLDRVRQAWQIVIKDEHLFRKRIYVSGENISIALTECSNTSWKETVLNNSDSYYDAMTQDFPEAILGNCFHVFSLDNPQDQGISTVIWTSHHALIDGYSAQLIHRRFRAALNGVLQTYRVAPSLDPSSAVAAFKEQQKPVYREFWQRKENNFQQPSSRLLIRNLQQDSVHSSLKSADIYSQYDAVSQLQNCALQHNVSVASIFHAAWGLALSAFSNIDEVRFGTTHSARDLGFHDLRDAIGCFINVLPLDVAITSTDSVVDYLRKVFVSLTELSQVQHSEPEDGFSRDFESVLAMQYPMEPLENDIGPRPVSAPEFSIQSRIPINMCIWESGQMKLSYHQQRYQKEDMANLLSFFSRAVTLLSTIESKIETALRQLMPSATREHAMRLTGTFSPATYKHSEKDDLVTMFEGSARTYPTLIALESSGKRFTYQQFDEMTSRAAYSLSLLIQKDDVVCVHADHTSEWILSIFAILKAGGVYSAMDAKAPTALRAANTELSTAKFFLVGRSDQKGIAPACCDRVVSFEELLKTENALPHKEVAEPDRNAYICFTSGSTGKAKGVICTHGGLVAFHRDEKVRMFAGPGTRISQVMSPAFDGSIHEIFSTLSHGGTLVLPKSADPFAHMASVDSAVVTPSIAKILNPQDLPQLKHLYVVGEPLPQDTSDLWSSQKRLFNMYGPTEGTCGATTGEMFPGNPVTIGKPNQSVRVYILDRFGNLSCPGVVGEVYLAGIQIAKGYIGLPEQTRSRFLIDSICGLDGESMYKTGDLGFFDLDGNVQLLGRNDRIVKLRGFRIDLNDVEARISAGIRGVEHVAVVRDGDDLLALISPASLDLVAIHPQLKEILPTYAVPRYTGSIDTLPQTQAGKLDYKQVTNIVRERNKADGEAARVKLTSTEARVAKIWKELMGLESDSLINPDSCFGALGGHSIMQLRQKDLIQKRFGLDVPLRLLMEADSLSVLARQLDRFASGKTTKRMKTQDKDIARALGRGNLSPLDLSWWHKYKYAGSENTSFTVTHAASLNPDYINSQTLARAWTTVIQRHEILQSRVCDSNTGHTVRKFVSDESVVRMVTSINLEAEVNRPISLSEQSPIRVLISPQMLFVAISHMVCDLTALQTILSEVLSVYKSKPLQPDPASFACTKVWSRKMTTSVSDFWRGMLSKPPTPKFPSRTSYAGTSLVLRVPTKLYSSMTDLSSKYNISLHELALAAVGLAMTHDDNSVDIVLGSPFFNRGAQDLNTVGNFVEALPVRVKFQPHQNESYLSTVCKSARSSLGQALGQSSLSSLLDIDSTTDLPNEPFFEAMVSFHDQSATKSLTTLDSLPGIESLLTWAQGSKFKIMFEFRAMSREQLVLRVEFDDSVVPGGFQGALRLAGRALRAMQGLMENASFDELKTLAHAASDNKGPMLQDAADEYFGRRMQA